MSEYRLKIEDTQMTERGHLPLRWRNFPSHPRYSKVLQM